MTQTPYSGESVELNEDTAKFIEIEWQKFLSHIKDLGFEFHLDSFDAKHKSTSPHALNNRIVFHVDGTVDFYFKNFKKINEKL